MCQRNERNILFLETLRRYTEEKARDSFSSNMAADKGRKPCTFNVARHQQAVSDWLVAHPRQNGLLVRYGMGTGKTLTACNSACRLIARGRIDAAWYVTPSKVVHKFSAEVDRCIGAHASRADRSRHVVVSHCVFASGGSSDTWRAYFAAAQSGRILLVIDEIHELRNPETALWKGMKRVSDSATLVVGLTGTPITNSLGDLAAIFALLKYPLGDAAGVQLKNRHLSNDAGKEEDPTDGGVLHHSAEAARFGGMADNLFSKYKVPGAGEERSPAVVEKMYLTNTDQLVRKLRNRVAYFEMDLNAKDIPKLKHYAIVVRPTSAQEKMFISARTASGATQAQLASILRAIGDTSGRKKAIKDQGFNAFLNKARRISNSIDLSEPCSEKISRLVHVARDKDTSKPVLVYSFFRNHGNGLVKQCLMNRGVKEKKILEIHGQTSRQELAAGLAAFRAGKIDYVLLNKAGNTGIDLDGVRTVFILEGQWNPTDVRQAVARATRLGSKVSTVNVISMIVRGHDAAARVDDHLRANMLRKLALSSEVDSILYKASIPVTK